MTPEERAKQVMSGWRKAKSDYLFPNQVEDVVESLIACAIREAEAAARAEEREACAVLSETRFSRHRGYSAASDLVKAGALAIAEEIRARSESEAPDA